MLSCAISAPHFIPFCILGIPDGKLMLWSIDHASTMYLFVISENVLGLWMAQQGADELLNTKALILPLKWYKMALICFSKLVFFLQFLFQLGEEKDELEPWLIKEMDELLSQAWLTGNPDIFHQIVHLIITENVSGIYSRIFVFLLSLLKWFSNHNFDERCNHVTSKGCTD